MALHVVSVHVRLLSWVMLLGGLCHRLLAFQMANPVIEEKGEGFENGKKFVGSFGVPSTSVFALQIRISRLKIRYSNKRCASSIKLKNNYHEPTKIVSESPYSQNAFESNLLRKAQLLTQPDL